MKVTNAEALKELQQLTNDTRAVNKKIYKITAQVRNDIKKRTQSGVDYKGASAPAYGGGYAEWKQEKKQRPVSHRDLTLSGNMLNSMKVRQTSNGSEIYFDKVKEIIKAIAHNFGFGQKQFEFFRLSRENMSYIISELQKGFR